MFAKLVCADGFRPQKSELKEIKKIFVGCDISSQIHIIFIKNICNHKLKIFAILVTDDSITASARKTSEKKDILKNMKL